MYKIFNNLMLSLLVILLLLHQFNLHAQTKDNNQQLTIFNATIGESNPKTPEISTEELKSILAKGKALLLDIRPHLEYSISHIPGSFNVAPKPGMSMFQYTSDVAEITRLVNSDKKKEIILYCNGPFCGKSKRVAEDLISDGFTNVKRYQLGAPVWRALGEVMEIEPDGIKHVIQNDKTAVFIDGRNSDEFNKSSLKDTRNIPQNKILPGKDVGELKAAKDDGRLPMEDHNTRIIVFGNNGLQAKQVAEAIAKEAFHNVSYFDGTFKEFNEIFINSK
ncbi:MAG: rhodanese-like domain-containing protein [Ignavibacteria bacterium]|nr:rhodanese-like domain-containing protein [Ignavibacteria bacterium]